MTDFIDVVEHNPIVFVKAITEALNQGYVVQNTIAGYPQFGAYGNVVRLFKGDRRGVTIIPTEHNGMVEHYDPMHFLLLLENFVLAGYTFKEDGKHFFDERGLKSVEMELVTNVTTEKPVEKEKPAKRAPAKKELKAEQTINELEV